MNLTDRCHIRSLFSSDLLSLFSAPLDGLTVRLLDTIAQYADTSRFNFYDVAGSNPAIDFKTAAAVHSARAEHITNICSLVLRGVGNHFRETPLHRSGSGFGPNLTIDQHSHFRPGHFTKL